MFRETAESNQEMVKTQLMDRGINDPLVLQAFLDTDRKLFVPEEYRDRAYGDYPLSIGYDQTISQPFIVAEMTKFLELTPHSRVLEIGTGSAYQTAILSRIAQEVFTIEIIPQLSQRAEKLLTDLGIDNVHFRIGDGYEGWPEHSPFDGIMLTSAPESMPENLVAQLATDGRMVVPVGRQDESQILYKINRMGDQYMETPLYPVRFVPMIKGTPEC